MVPRTLHGVGLPLPAPIQHLSHADYQAKWTPRWPQVRPAEPSTIESSGAECIVSMGASALFTGLTPGECKEIAACARARTFAPNELLFIQGQPVRSLVYLQCGIVKVSQLSIGGKEVIIWMNGSGEAIGIPGDSPFSSHSCSGRAMERCRALTWDYSLLQILIARYPRLRTNISQVLASRLQELEERFREMATEKVAQRLALVLSRLIKQIGKKTSDGIEICLTREEFAKLTGTTLFTVSRILNRWAEMGVVVPRREAVVVADPELLGSMGCGQRRRLTRARGE